MAKKAKKRKAAAPVQGISLAPPPPNRSPDDWHRFFLGMALHCARFSKDPRTQVGAVIVDGDRIVRATGFNGFPRGLRDDHRLLEKAAKNRIIVHAEMNAVLQAARVGVPLDGCSLYIACTDKTRLVWGGPPCVRCAVEIMQTGIRDIYSFEMKEPSSWSDDLKYAVTLIEEAGIRFRELTYR